MYINHDCQFLFIKNHVLIIIHYMMKYIFKLKIILYFKLIIVVVIYKMLSRIFFFFFIDFERKMILKIYNKLNNYHEVDISETISYLLEFSDHYTNKTFQYIHIIHLLHYFKTHLKKDFFHINNNILNIDS